MTTFVGDGRLDAYTKGKKTFSLYETIIALHHQVYPEWSTSPWSHIS